MIAMRQKHLHADGKLPHRALVRFGQIRKEHKYFIVGLGCNGLMQSALFLSQIPFERLKYEGC